MPIPISWASSWPKDYPKHSGKLKWRPLTPDSTLVDWACKEISSIDDTFVKVRAVMMLANSYGFESICNQIKQKCEDFMVYTTPSDGYEDDNCLSHDPVGDVISVSKRTAFGRMLSSYPSMFRFLPAMFVLSPMYEPTERHASEFPFSIHDKHVFIRCRSGGFVILFSSNLAFGDPHKINIAVLWSLNEDEATYLDRCHDVLDKTSIASESYKGCEYYYKCRPDLVVPCERIPLDGGFVMMHGAPFDKSNMILHREIIEVLETSREDVYIQAQHIGDINGLSRTLAQRGGNSRIVMATCPEKWIPAGKNFLKPNNDKLIDQFITELHSSESCCVDIVSDNHAKFIVCGDSVIQTSCNYSKSSLTYQAYTPEGLPFYVDHKSGKIFEGIFSEQGLAIKCRSHSLACFLRDVFDKTVDEYSQHRIAKAA